MLTNSYSQLMNGTFLVASKLCPCTFNVFVNIHVDAQLQWEAKMIGFKQRKHFKLHWQQTNRNTVNSKHYNEVIIVLWYYINCINLLFTASSQNSFYWRNRVINVLNLKKTYSIHIQYIFNNQQTLKELRKQVLSYSENCCIVSIFLKDPTISL